ncbi:cation diffusion facilitator family transporter [Pyrolobus fumarii 1A]|uniref:Cation diffusion facilitator family transporter n=1 Tax=Pyrolobus fumarii (strain DSM 11204 / 1A) TaxID=694429 RepID=G0EFV0_PYRF1|nr:cation transporter [Pyrolobus fumarii]AEM39051.1 cation diffusion facilitator family transporter [Pyrolobus fumarii 1A]
MVRRLAVRKILVASGALRAAYTVALVSLLLSLVGLVLYLREPSDVILMEAFVWLIEAMSFGSLAVAFRVAASRTVAYRARYEILRLESLAVLVASIIAVMVTLAVAARNAVAPHPEPTPAPLAAYPLASAAASYVLERFMLRSLRRVNLDIVAVRMIAEKLRLDMAFELGGGAAILLANTAATPLPEQIAALAMGAYVTHGLLGMAREAATHLIGIVPRRDHQSIAAKVKATLRKTTRYTRIRKLRVESYGTFREVEVWLEAPPTMTLEEAYQEAQRIARRLIHEIPELLRALVLLVPATQKENRQPPTQRTARSAARKKPAAQLATRRAPRTPSVSHN